MSIGKNSNNDKIHKAAAEDVAALMSALLRKYRHHPGVLAMVLTDSLASFVAITADNATEILPKIAERIKATDVAALKRDYFGWRILDGTAAAESSALEHQRPEGGADPGPQLVRPEPELGAGAKGQKPE